MTRFTLIAVLFVGSVPATAGSPSGAARAIDGDSLVVGGVEVRLHGIDAPEFDQSCSRAGTTWACGRASADQMTKLIAGQHVICTAVGQDQHGRTLGQCKAGNTDLNRMMVAGGYALAYRRYSTAYVSAEDSARLAKRGIWSGTFEQPGEVRHAGEDYRIEPPPAPKVVSGGRPVVLNSRAKPQPSGNCRIKGNHSRKGEKIYHLPGKPYYAQTVAEEIFCTEAQARAAGYRRSRAH